MEEYLAEIRQCLVFLKVFQYATLAIIVIVGLSFYFFQQRIKRVLLAVSFILLVGMLVYEAFNYECMSSGFYGVPIGLQIVLLLACLFMFCNKDD